MPAHKPVDPASFPLLGLLGAVACGPIAPESGTGATDSTGDGPEPTSASDPSTPTTTAIPECQSDLDCTTMYCEYCADNICVPRDACCYDGLVYTGDGHWRCGPGYECYGDEDCEPGYVCILGECAPDRPIPEPTRLPTCDSPDGLGTAWDLVEAPSALVLADVDLDMDLDLIAAQPGSGRLEIAFNDGVGQFTGQDSLVGQAPDYTLAAGDIDGDGDPDLALAAADPAGLRLFFNDGAVFTPGEPLPLGRLGGQVHLADINGDAALDVLVLGLGSGASSVRLGDGVGGLSDELAGVLEPINAPGTFIDVSADGIADLIGHPLADNILRAYGGTTEPGFVPLQQFMSTGVHAPALVADLDNDLAHDIVAVQSSDGGGTIDVWLALEPSVWSPRPSHFLTSAAMTGGVLAETDLVAGPDLIAATGDPNILVALGDGLGGFMCQRFHETTGDSRPNLFAVGDVDGDGRNDILAGGAGETTITMVLLK
jgi:hypothetical protein